MARIRTIKPEFFTSEDICALSPLARLLYIATWLEADREGRLEWKPRTWKIRYFPVDDLDVDATAGELVERRLIVRYGDGFAWIPSFAKHQIVNNREAESRLPDPQNGSVTNGAVTPNDVENDLVSGDDDLDHSQKDLRFSRVKAASFTRESGVCDDSSLPFLSNTNKRSRKKQTRAEGSMEGFDTFWSLYPRKTAKAAAVRAWRKLHVDAALTATIIRALDEHMRTDAWLKDGGEFVPYPASWLNGRRWEDVLTAPKVVAAAPGVDRQRERSEAILKSRLAMLRGERA